MQVLDALENEFNIDKRREYITGLSGGGKGTWVAFLSHPGRFAAAIPLCARQSVKPEEADLSNYAKMAKSLPMWMWHGVKDPVNEVANSRVMFKALQGIGSNARYTEIPDAPHNCWDVAYSSDELHDWLFAQSLPSSVSVEPEARAGRRDAVTKSNPWRVEDHPLGFKPRTFTRTSRGKLNYRLFVPENYDPNRKSATTGRAGGMRKAPKSR
jgi:predicted peptidase